MDNIRSRWITAQIKKDEEAGMSKEVISEKLKSDKYGFQHEMFDELRKRQNEQDEYVSNPYEVEEGVVECDRCGSKRVYSVSVQIRSADEPTSTRAFCVICKHRWTQNY